MANKEILYSLLDKFREYIGKLKVLQEKSKEEFIGDWIFDWSLDRGLQLSIECSVDIGQEIISGKNLRKPKTYKETFLVLAEAGIISKELSENLQRLSKFRNELVHDYMIVGTDEIYEVLENDVKYFEEYLLAIEKFIKEKENAE